MKSNDSNNSKMKFNENSEKVESRKVRRLKANVLLNCSVV